MNMKTSISIDKQIWMELKNLALERGKDISTILKDAIENELNSNLFIYRYARFHLHVNKNGILVYDYLPASHHLEH